MKLEPRRAAEFANAIAHALGLRDVGGPLSFDEPATPRALEALQIRLGKALDALRPAPHAPSIGEVVAVLAWSAPGSANPRRWPPRPSGRPRWSARRGLAELTELVAQGSFERTKRAERGRVLAQLILLFDLEGTLGLSFPASTDPEDALRKVRRALTRP